MQALPCIELSSDERRQLKALALQTITQGLEHHHFQPPKAPTSTNLQKVATSFVTLYVNQQLRGCIGSIKASEALWLDVCRHSYSSAFDDSRFPPLHPSELTSLTFTISVLSEMVPIKNNGQQALLSQLESGVDGLLINQGFRSAVFLPTVWHSLPKPEHFLSALKQKGGWPDDYWSNEIELFLFHTSLIE